MILQNVVFSSKKPVVDATVDKIVTRLNAGDMAELLLSDPVYEGADVQVLSPPLLLFLLSAPPPLPRFSGVLFVYSSYFRESLRESLRGLRVRGLRGCVANVLLTCG